MGTFWPNQKRFFWTWREKIVKFDIFRPNFPNPNYKWLTQPDLGQNILIRFPHYDGTKGSPWPNGHRHLTVNQDLSLWVQSPTMPAIFQPKIEKKISKVLTLSLGNSNLKWSRLYQMSMVQLIWKCWSRISTPTWVYTGLSLLLWTNK